MFANISKYYYHIYLYEYDEITLLNYLLVISIFMIRHIFPFKKLT